MTSTLDSMKNPSPFTTCATCCQCFPFSLCGAEKGLTWIVAFANAKYALAVKTGRRCGGAGEAAWRGGAAAAQVGEAGRDDEVGVDV
jgi:hypothetical protein